MQLIALADAKDVASLTSALLAGKKHTAEAPQTNVRQCDAKSHERSLGTEPIVLSGHKALRDNHLLELGSGSGLACPSPDGGVFMKIAAGRNQYSLGVLGFVAGAVYLLGPAARNNAARVPNANRDVESSLQADFVWWPAAAAAPTSELTKDASFTNQSDVREYRFTLDTDSDDVHLTMNAEIKQGLLRFESIDPTRAVRTRIGTTERASMDTGDIKAINGEWLLQMTLESATGKYQVRWVP